MRHIKSIFVEMNFFLTTFSMSEKLKYLSWIPINLFKHIFYLLSFTIPRRKDIWIFGSWGGKRFSDNSKYMFLHVINNHKEIKPIWISKDKEIVKKLKENNYYAYYAFEIKGIYFNLRAKYIFSDNHLDSVNYWCCGGATIIQLGHGTPIKKVEHDVKNLPWNKPISKYIYMYFNPWLLAKNDFVVSPGDYFVDNFVTAFQIKRENVLITGFPRNDVIFGHIEGENLLDSETYDKFMRLKIDNPYSRLIFYMPTFRDTENLSNSNIEKIIDFDELNKFLMKINAYFVVKLHPIMKVDINKHYERIIFLPSNFDPYPLFSKIDILATDYSSVFFDFLLTEKPIIFFSYDLEKYLNNDRELNINYEKFTPGPKAFTFTELLDWIDYFVKGNDGFVKSRKIIANTTFKYIDGNASERIFNLIYNL